MPGDRGLLYVPFLFLEGKKKKDLTESSLKKTVDREESELEVNHNMILQAWNLKNGSKMTT